MMESSWNPSQEIGSSPTILDYQTVSVFGVSLCLLCDAMGMDGCDKEKTNHDGW